MTTPNPFQPPPAAGFVVDELDQAAHLDQVDQLEDEPAAGTPVRELADAPEPSTAKKLSGRFARIVLEGPDGADLEPFEVRIDNRDYLAWDKTAPVRKWVKKKDDPLPMFLMATFLAWNACRRKGLTQLTFDQFQAAAIDVEEFTPEDPEDDGAARPTR